MVAGCPRTVSKSPEEMIELGKEMVEWVRINKPVHLNQWWLIEKDIRKDVWHAYRQVPEFKHYYEKALSMIGNLYIDKDSNVDPRVKDRFLRLYHKDLEAQEDSDSDKEAQRKKLVTESIDQESLAKFALFMEQVNTLQRKKDLNVSEINNSEEAKS